jgi:ribulose kinase
MWRIFAQTKEVLDAMVADAGREGFSLLRVDGGASRNSLLMQLQADAIQVPPSITCSPPPWQRVWHGETRVLDCTLGTGC